MRAPEGWNTMRHSEPRRILLEELQGRPDHPTAAELHESIRHRLPRVSLGTVYRNLELFERQGLLRKLVQPGGRARYDAELHPHAHIRCVECGRIADAPEAPAPAEKSGAQLPTDLEGFRILGARLEYFGLCPACRQRAAAAPRQGRAPTES